MFYKNVIKIIKQIPFGKVATYGQIALYAGNHRASRQVAFILNSSSKKENLPWFRIINSKGFISLKPGSGYEIQKNLLENEGIIFNKDNSLDLSKYLWRPEKNNI